MEISDLKDKKIAILGFGVNNRELTFWLLRNGIKVSVCDQNQNIKEEVFNCLDKSRQKLLDHVKDWRVGEYYLKNLTDFDIVFRSPGIPYLNEDLQLAKQNGVTIYSQTELFLQLAPCLIIGVTGTKGKSTTAAMIAHLLDWSNVRGQLLGVNKVYLAGNIGQDPFEFLDKLEKEDIVVLELSSFQLQGLTTSPKIAVVTRVTSDHLDHHQSLTEYFEAKLAIVEDQRADDYLVINIDEIENQRFIAKTQAQVIRYSSEEILDQGAYIGVGESGKREIIIADPENRSTLLVGREDETQIKGFYNLENWAAAVSLGYFIFKISAGDCREALKSFKSLPYRLQFVKKIHNISYYNDSYSTNPASTISAIKSFSTPLILICGGSSKGADFLALGQEILQNKNIKAVLTIGQEGDKILESIQSSPINESLVLKKFSNLSEAFNQVKIIAQAGDIILLSPACASFGEFKNAADRGQQFNRLVSELNG